LPEKAGVVAIPLSAFVSPDHQNDYAGLVRFAACKRIEVLEEAAARLSAARW
jgi:N-succinyldiaminopimelate aminotransferase